MLGSAARRLKTALTGVADLPRDLAIMQTYDRIQTAFPAACWPADVAVEVDDVSAPAVQDADRRLSGVRHSRPA